MSFRGGSMPIPFETTCEVCGKAYPQGDLLPDDLRFLCDACRRVRWIDPKDRAPDLGVPVRALLKGATTGRVVESVLVRVDESDCYWRTADDHSEVDFNWDVIGWLPLGVECQPL